jgi:hypothetical protein
VAFSCSVLICLSWVCYFDWQEQIVAMAADDEEPDAVEHDAMHLDAMDPDAGPEV